MKNRSLSHVLAVSALCLTSVVWAQSDDGHKGPGGPGPQGQWRAQSAAHRAEHFEHKMAEFKVLLQIAPNQEQAWSDFVAAVRPKADTQPRADWKQLDKLTTPERLDRMHAMHEQQDAMMQQRESATKTFYNSLTPAQRKAFDLIMQKRAQRHMEHLRDMQMHMQMHMDGHADMHPGQHGPEIHP